MFMAAILLTVIGTAILTDLAGLSMALGAFLAGLLLGETEYRHEVEVDIEPFKGLLLALFFMSVGMGIDYRVVGDLALWIGLSVLGLFVLKSLITGGLCLAFGLPRHVSLEAGLLLGQGGEFAFVVVGLAMTLGLVPPDTGHFMLMVAGLSMVVTPLVALTGKHLAAAVERRSPTERNGGMIASIGEVEGHVILAGYGRIGRLMGEILDAEGIAYIALETDPLIVARERAQNVPIYYGDASRPEMLRRAKPENAAALVLTLNDAAANERIVRTVHADWPDLPIHARARDPAHARKLLALGATDAMPETTEAALQMGVRLLHEIGLPTELALRRIETQRTRAMDALRV
ncbi:MAG: NAD-binding protein, partial [Pseudomonadota bacterium]